MKKILVKALSRMGLLKFLNLQVNVRVNNQKVKIPILMGIGLGNVVGSEPWMIELLREIFKIKKGGAYYDVGVNLGQTLIKLKSVDPEMEYVGFEPNPICVVYAKELIKANGYAKTTVFPVGISNEATIYALSFFAEDAADSSASMLENFRPLQKTFRKEFIPCFNLEKISEKYTFPTIGILKIDVEGAEKEVLEAFESRIQQDKPYIQLEILPVYSEANTERLERQTSIETLLRRIDYAILRVHTTEKGGFKGLEQIATIGIHSSMKWCEYVLIPNSEIGKFTQKN